MACFVFILIELYSVEAAVQRIVITMIITEVRKLVLLLTVLLALTTFLSLTRRSELDLSMLPPLTLDSCSQTEEPPPDDVRSA